MVLASKIGAMIIGISFFDLGLNLTPYTLLWMVIFCIELILILYLAFFLFKVRSGRLSTGTFVISAILCAISITTLFVSQGTKDCLTADVFMMCVTAGFAWPIFGFSIGSWIIAFAISKKRKLMSE